MTRRITKAPVFLALMAAACSIICSVFPKSALASEAYLVKDINPNGGSGPNGLEEFNGTLLFQAADGVHGPEIWVSDGTAAGTSLVRDIRSGPEGSYARAITAAEGIAYFSADDGALGHELWSTDGTESGTSLIRDINPGPVDSWPGPSVPFTRVGELFFFMAYTNASGYELFRSDGTAGGTALARDINPGTENSTPVELVEMGGSLFFRADDGLPAGNHRELWRSDGTENGTAMVKDIHPSDESYPSDLTALNGIIYFSADDGINGRELWRSDGAEGGTVMVRDINPAGSSRPAQLRVFQGYLYFVADDGVHGAELWRSDGTVAGTEMAVDLNPAGGSPIGSLTVSGGALYFVLRVAGFREELWAWDGSTAQMLHAFTPSNYHPLVQSLTDVQGILYFTANDGVHGAEVWRSDGTAEGTELAADINVGDEWSFSWPRSLTAVGSMLFFSADDGALGHELWALRSEIVTSVAEQTPAAPAITLLAGVPNPFGPETTLRFDLRQPSAVQLRVFDAQGRLLRELVPGRRMEAGRQAIRWDGRDRSGRKLESGVYHYVLEAGRARATGRLVMIR